MEPEAHILLVDDSAELLDTLQLTLELAGYATTARADAQLALELLESQPVDLIISDIAMPGLNGYQFYRRVREQEAWTHIPFLFLTARSLDSDVRFGRELGVDDYLIKPIQPDDLLAVVRGRLARARQLRSAPGSPTFAPLAVGALSVDSAHHRAWLDGQPLTLAAREFQLLELLAQRVDQVVTARELLQATHGIASNEREASRLLRPLIRSLRRKLGYSVGEMGCIENVRGLGYRLVPMTRR